jgi:hypothetical protein
MVGLHKDHSVITLDYIKVISQISDGKILKTSEKPVVWRQSNPYNPHTKYKAIICRIGWITLQYSIFQH